MPFNIKLIDGDGFIDMQGHLVYPNLNETALKTLETSLVRTGVDHTLISQAVQNNKAGEHDPKSGDELGMREISLIIARLKQAGIPYADVLTAIIPDYRKKIAALCDESQNFDFIPSTHPTIGKNWTAISKIIFSNSEPLSSEELMAKMAQARIHGLQYIPPYVNELGSLYREFAGRLPLPIFTLLHQTESSAPSLQWHMAGDWNVLSHNNRLWSEGIAPAGTNFVGMCEEGFFTKPVKTPGLYPDYEPES